VITTADQQHVKETVTTSLPVATSPCWVQMLARGGQQLLLLSPLLPLSERVGTASIHSCVDNGMHAHLESQLIISHESSAFSVVFAVVT
jgi:hypothetical protein